MWVSDQGQCQARVVATARLGLECRQLAFVRPPYEHALGADCWVVSLHDDNRVRVWDWYDGRCLSATSQTFLQPLARATLLRALQERLLAIGGEDNVLHIVDSWTLTKLSSYRLPGRLVDLAAQTHDHGGRLLALCGEDQVLLWELSNAPGFLIDDYCPRPMDSRPTLKLTMRTSELPRLISLSQDCSLLVVAYENIISFVHESWVSATQFYKTSRDEAYMCMSSPVVAMTFTEGTFVVGLENGLLAEFEIREIMSSAGIGEPGERKVKGNASTGEGEISPLSNERVQPVPRPRFPSKDLSARPTRVYDLSPFPTVSSLPQPSKCLVAASGFLYLSQNNSIASCSAGNIGACELTLSTLSLRDCQLKDMADAQLQTMLRDKEKVTDAHLIMAHSWPLYVVGTSEGRMIVVPLAPAHPIRCLDPGTFEAISCLLYYRSSLLSCSVSGTIHIWSLTTADLKRSTSTSSCSSGSGQPIDLQTHLPMRTFSIPYEGVTVMKQLHSLHEAVEGLKEEDWFEKWKYWQMMILGQLEDESLVLISLERCAEVCAFYGFKGRLKEVYVHLLLDYLLIANQEGDCSVFNMSSLQLERVLSTASLPYKAFHQPHCTPTQSPDVLSLPHQLLECYLQGLTASHSQALVWTEYPTIGGIQFPLLCLNVGLIAQSFEEMEEIPEQAEFVISVLKMWGKGQNDEQESLQETLKSLFHAYTPSVLGTAGVFGLEESLSFRLPGHFSPWETSAHLTSLVSLSLFAVLQACVHFRPTFQPLLDRYIISHLASFAQKLTTFHRPSLILLGIEALRGSKVAFELLTSSLQLFTVPEREEMLKDWQKLHKASIPNYESTEYSDTEGSPLLASTFSGSFPVQIVGDIEALSALMVGLVNVSGVKAEFLSEIGVTLLWMLRGHRESFVLAAEHLLVSGIKLWREEIHKKLFMELAVSLLALHYTGDLAVRTGAKRALMAAGKADVETFTRVLSSEVMKLAGRRDYPSSVLVVLQCFTETHIYHTLGALPDLTEIVLRSLDPREILLRKLCVDRATEVLETLVQVYPMVAFQPSLQLVAVGSCSSHIFIYDLKLGTRWKDLSAHKGPVSAICFSPTGDLMVSYSTSDSLIKVWSLGGAFFGLGSLDVSEGQAIELPAVTAAVTSSRELLQTVRLGWKGPGEVLLGREDAQTYLVTLS